MPPSPTSGASRLTMPILSTSISCQTSATTTRLTICGAKNIERITALKRLVFCTSSASPRPRHRARGTSMTA